MRLGVLKLEGLEDCVFGVLDVAVTLGIAFLAVALKLCFRDKSQLKWRFWRMAFRSCVVQILLKMISSLLRGRRSVLCVLEVSTLNFCGRRRESCIV